MLMIFFALKCSFITLFGMGMLVQAAGQLIRQRRSGTAHEPEDTAGDKNRQSKNKRHCASPAGFELIQP